jgi:hypothetical protein
MNAIGTFALPLKDQTAQTAIIGVLLLILLDFLIGVVGAVMTKSFSSPKMRSGLLHKFTELVCVALGVILDGMLVGGLNLPFEPILIGTCIYVGLMETGSILELVQKYNPDADGLVGYLTQFVQPKGSSDTSNNTNGRHYADD